MNEPEVLMLIMNCKKYEWKADIQRNTWLKTIPSFIKYYHVIGNEDLESEYVFVEESKLLYVKTPDDYNSLPNKVITAFKAINDNFSFKYIFKTDDDQNLINEKFFDILYNLLNAKGHSIHYGGHIVEVTTPYLSEYYKIHPELPKDLPIQITKYCSGRFYFLSHKAIQNLLPKRETIAKEFLEDYSIGYNLHIFFKNNMLKLNTNKAFIDIQPLEKVEPKVEQKFNIQMK
jgi:hypothetical protein